MATVDCGMHQTSVGVLVMLCEDTIMRNGEAEGKRDFHLSSQLVESSRSICTNPLDLASPKELP